VLKIESIMAPFIAEVASIPGATKATVADHLTVHVKVPTSLLRPMPIESR